MNKVIIDGVDVAGCKYINNGWCLLSESCNDIKYLLCGDMTLQDCYFKQLQRAKAELEQYKKSKQASYEYMQIEWNKARNELKDIKKENERLKEENDNLKRFC